MIVMETWRRFAANWPLLTIAGVFHTILHGLAGLIAAGPLRAFTAAVKLGVLERTMDPLALGTIGGKLLGALVLLVVVNMLVWPLATGGLYHMVIHVQRGRTVSPTEFWSAAIQHWPRLFGLVLITGCVTLCLVVLLLVSRVVPVLGPVVWGVIAGILMLALTGYGPYMVVGEGLGPLAASRKAFRILTNRVQEAAVTLLLMIFAAVVLTLVMIGIGAIPVLGLLVKLMIQIVLAPLIVLYLVIRYQRNIAPYIPFEGQAGLHRDPPPGA